MDEPQIRRRRPAITYGKTSRKKRSVDEIFVSSQTPINSQLPLNPPLIRVGLVKPHLDADKLVLDQTKSKLPKNKTSASLLCERRTRPCQSQTPTEITSFAQPSEEPRSKPINQSLKRKRTPSVASKIPTVAVESSKVHQNKSLHADNGATMGKRSRSTRNTPLVNSIASPQNANFTTCEQRNRPTQKEYKVNVRKPSMAPPSVSPKFEKAGSTSQNTSTSSTPSLSSKIVASGNKYIQRSMHTDGNVTKRIAHVPCIKNSLSNNTAPSPDVILIGDEISADSCSPSIRLTDNLVTQAHVAKMKASPLSQSKAEVIQAKRPSSSGPLRDPPIKLSYGLDEDAAPDIPAIVVSKPVLT